MSGEQLPWYDIYAQFDSIDYYLVVIAFATLATALLSKRFLPKLPNLLIGMTVGSLLAIGLAPMTESIKLVGEIPAHLPPLSSPDFS